MIHQALFFAEQADAPEVSARWYRQLGQLRNKQGYREQAIAAYDQALDHLQGIQSALLFGRRGYPGAFRDTVGRVYLELAALLLEKAETADDRAVQQQALRRIRDVMEDFKAVELRNHFRDYCVTAQQEKNHALDVDSLITQGTATFYPVVFQDRTVLLLAFATGEIKAASVAVRAEELRRAAERLRRQMHPSRNPRRLLRDAQTLYDWLIKPIEAELRAQSIDTLVIVPDDVLRTIPFAVLHDGRDFLISRYAVAVTPGLMLTDPSGFSRGAQRLLVNGLSKGVQGFDGLPYVNAEVAGITSVYGGTELLNEGFVKNKVIEELAGADTVDRLIPLVTGDLDPDLSELLQDVGVELTFKGADKPFLGVAFRANTTTIASVTKDSPAYRAGLARGDEVLAANNLRSKPDRWQGLLAAVG